MTAFGLILVLVAAVCHATWNYFVKRINAGPELVWLFSLISVLLYAPLAIYFALQIETFSLEAFLFVVGSVFLHLGYFLLLQAGYRNGDLSVVYPTARATGPLLSVLLAVGLLGEHLSMQGAVGGLIIIFGVLMLSGGLKGRTEGAHRSVLFGISAGFLIGSYTVWDAHTVATLLVPPLLLDYASNFGRVILLAPIALKRRSAVQRLWQKQRFGVMMIAIFSPLAYILALIAMTFTPVTFIAPLREVSVVLSVLLGSLLLGEGNLKHRLFWSIIILAGVSTLASA